MNEIIGKIVQLTEKKEREKKIESAVDRVIGEYGEALKKLGENDVNESA